MLLKEPGVSPPAETKMNPILAFCSLLALVSAGPTQYFREEFGDGGERPSSVVWGGGGGAEMGRGI